MTVYVVDVEKIKEVNKTRIEKAKDEKELLKALKDWLLDYEYALKRMIIEIKAADGKQIRVISMEDNK